MYPQRYVPGLGPFKDRLIDRIVQRASVKIGRKGNAEEPQLLNRTIELMERRLSAVRIHRRRGNKAAGRDARGFRDVIIDHLHHLLDRQFARSSRGYE